MIDIALNRTAGPRTDGTSDYELSFPDGLCFGDFIMWVHKESSFEEAYSWYGDVLRRTSDNNVTKTFEYKNGRIVFDKSYIGFDTTTFYNAIFTKRVAKIIAEGGFGRMDYVVWFKEKPSA